jgi:hypothetical protein
VVYPLSQPIEEEEAEMKNVSLSLPSSSIGPWMCKGKEGRTPTTQLLSSFFSDWFWGIESKDGWEHETGIALGFECKEGKIKKGYWLGFGTGFALGLLTLHWGRTQNRASPVLRIWGLAIVLGDVREGREGGEERKRGGKTGFVLGNSLLG